MEGFVIFDKDHHEINEAGLRVIHTSNSGAVVAPGATPQQPAYFGFKCPQGQGNCHYLRIRGGPADDGKRPTWTWDGRRDKPTLMPSINCLAHNPQNPAEKYAGCGWHGFITKGAYVDA